MYPYHNKIKQRIKNEELIGYEYVKSYNKITPCLLLYFSTGEHGLLLAPYDGYFEENEVYHLGLNHLDGFSSR